MPTAILRVLHGAHALADLKGKSYGAHRLTGDRAGEWSIRINRKWRICSVWRDGDAFEVEIADYH